MNVLKFIDFQEICILLYNNKYNLQMDDMIQPQEEENPFGSNPNIKTLKKV